MNQLIRVAQGMGRGWAGSGQGAGRGDIRDRHARASKGRARPTQNAYLNARGERRPVIGHRMAFLARSVRGQQDPPATEATPSQPSQPSQPSTPPFRVGLFRRLGAGPAALAGKAIINATRFILIRATTPTKEPVRVQYVAIFAFLAARPPS